MLLFREKRIVRPDKLAMESTHDHKEKGFHQFRLRA
jgi:hypothetical protein